MTDLEHAEQEAERDAHDEELRGHEDGMESKILIIFALTHAEAALAWDLLRHGQAGMMHHTRPVDLVMKKLHTAFEKGYRACS